MPVFNKMVYNGTEYILGGGGNIGEPLNLTVTTSGLDATITWTDNEIGTIPPTSFAKSELVRKVGSAPTSPSDGTLVVTETVKDTYKTTGYVDQGLTDGETYYYRVFSYSDLGGISYCDAVSVTISAGGWTPGANTVVYYPLTEDILDHSGNSYNLTAYGGNNYSFTTNSQGLACINLNPGDTKTYFKSTPTIDFSTRDYTFVCKICDVLTNYTSSWASAVMFCMASNFKGPVISMNTYDPAADLGTTAGYRELPVGGTFEQPQAKIPLTGSNFVTYICVRDHTALTLTSYFDGVYNLKGTFSSAPSSYQTLTLFRDVYDNSAGRFLHGKMRDVIVEDKAWTLQEIQDFSS